MVWLTWRQHRMQVLLTMAFVAVVGGVLVVHQLRTADLTAELAPDSAGFTAALGAQFGQVENVLAWLGVVPALIGLFWGTPLLAREFERGTHRLAWTQSVPRRGWLWIKFAGLGAVVTLVGLAFGAIVEAWLSRFAVLPSAGRLSNQELFVSTGVVPAAWWLFAFVLGAAAGALLRKTLPAMAVMIAVFAAAYVSLFATDARQHYAMPTRVEQANPVVRGEGGGYINTPSGAVAQLPVGAMLVASGWVDTSGRVLPNREMWACANTSSDYLACMADHDYRWFAEYHAADQYWRFQLTEAGILLIATLALGGVVVHQVRRGAA